MYKVPAIVNLRKLVRDVRDSSQWKKIEKDFKYLVKTDRHKEMVKMQVDTFNKAAKFMKMSEDDAEYVSPENSPIMFDAFHFLYVYF